MIKSISGYFFAAFRTRYYYRLNTVFQLIGVGVIILIQYFIWINIENGNPNVSNNIEIILYVILTPILMRMLPSHSTVQFLATKIIDGRITTLLLKPIPLFLINMANELGTILYKIIFITLPTLLIGGIFLNELDLSIITFERILFFSFAYLNSFILAFLILQLISYLAIFTGNYWGIMEFYDALLIIFGGILIPIALYPDWLQEITSFLPFQAIISTPISYLTNSTLNTSTPIIIQIIWIIIFALINIIASKLISKNSLFFGG
ncbi:ABC-2 family transporter protein [Lysinibacillus xylanilyticus]|uniref:ABC-2 family transporter protein n=1 Tax=Lysinibacillus xylanilyticus TaxID=582475 RepID=UPI003813DA09